MRIALLLVATLFSLSACGTDSPRTPTQPLGSVASIVLFTSSTDDMTSAGDTRTISATAHDVSGGEVSANDLTWTLSVPGVATLTTSGATAIVTAIDDGITQITASVGGASATVPVRVKRRLVSIEYARGDSVLPVGGTLGLMVIGHDARGQPMNNLTDATFRSDNRGSIIVSPAGNVTALFTGHGNFMARVTATIVRDGVAFSCARLFSVLSPVPPVYESISYMIPQSVLPEPVDENGEGLVFFRREGNSIKYGLHWSYLTGAPVGVHIHVSPDTDAASDVLVDLPFGNAAGIHGAFTGSFTASDIRSVRGRSPITLDSLMSLMTVFGAYVDIPTSRHTRGEIGNLIYPKMP